MLSLNTTNKYKFPFYSDVKAIAVTHDHSGDNNKRVVTFQAFRKVSEEDPGRPVCIKPLKREDDPLCDFISTKSEIAAHPHIMPTIDMDRDENGGLHAIMPYMQTSTLQDWSKQRLAKCKVEADFEHYLQDIIDISITIAQTLKHMHENGVIHNDVKPPNILIDTTGGKKAAAKWATPPADFTIKENTPYPMLIDTGISVVFNPADKQFERRHSSGEIPITLDETQQRHKCIKRNKMLEIQVPVLGFIMDQAVQRSFSDDSLVVEHTMRTSEYSGTVSFTNTTRTPTPEDTSNIGFGTACFAAPEQFCTGQGVNPETDSYLLASTFFYLLTHNHPHVGVEEAISNTFTLPDKAPPILQSFFAATMHEDYRMRADINQNIARLKEIKKAAPEILDLLKGAAIYRKIKDINKYLEKNKKGSQKQIIEKKSKQLVQFIEDNFANPEGILSRVIATDKLDATHTTTGDLLQKITSRGHNETASLSNLLERFPNYVRSRGKRKRIAKDTAAQIIPATVTKTALPQRRVGDNQLSDGLRAKLYDTTTKMMM